MLPDEAFGKATQTRTASTLFGAFFGRHSELYRSGGATANRILATLRLVECRCDIIRDADRIASIFCQFSGRNATQSKYPCSPSLDSKEPLN